MLFSTLIFPYLFFIPLTAAILDDDIHYDIKWQPELTTPIELDNPLIFTSKRKEKYACVLPTPQKAFSSTADAVLVSEIEPLLQELHSKKFCTYRFDPYWIYEFCPGKHIRQYHEIKVGNKRTVTQEYHLGYYHADQQTSSLNANNEPVFKVHYKKANDHDVPMFSARYTGGTSCEINANQPRETLVFFVCHDKGTDGIVHFQEVSSCYYEMIVSAPWLCKLPAFSPAEPNQYSIQCYPHEKALQKPRNLMKLERERQLSLKKGGGAQFTMTSADGTTLIISYDYVKDRDVNELANTINYDLNQESTPPPSPPPPPQPPTPNNADLTAPVILASDRQFLEEFFSGRRCLTSGSGWWRHEICYGKYVMQVHDEGGQRTSITLGKWNLEKHIEWAAAHAKKRSMGNRKDRQYVSLYYTDGDHCQSSNVPRTVEVKLRCSKRSDPSQSTSMYLVEPDTCSYILGVESPLFCNLIDFTDEHGIPDQEKLIKQFPLE